ncbi:MAG TPA: NADP-dependent malic enzyme [Candidatus Aenigmarchaeota archaeon]|nr:NADP-dependent malic enzyme [Candidatus Aenigmarchaeota archaeon]
MKNRILELAKKQKIKICPEVKIKTKEDLSILYTPGVAELCKIIRENENKIYEYTSKRNLVAIVSDGSAVLGLGNIGHKASYPVMEGKALLFKEFGNIDAIPIIIKSQEVKEIVKTVEEIADSFGAINLEDIAAPKCFEVERELKEKLNIPIFHDDQHGTAIVVLAALINSLKLVGKGNEVKIVISGAGAAGIAISKFLYKYGFKNIIVCDSKGIISKNRTNLNEFKKELLEFTNKENLSGSLKEAMINADVFIGVSAPNIVSKEMVQSMNDTAIVFAMANPVPEIMPEEAKKGGARIVATGRSDFPNQVNNALAFPGIFRGTLDAKAQKITEEMKIAAAEAISSYIKEEDLREDYIVPSILDRDVHKKVAEAVRKKAIEIRVVRES